MTRSRASAKAAGTRFESDVVRFLVGQLGDDRIERRAKSGAKDRGDVAGVRTALGERVVIECKDVARLNLAGWVDEADIERGHDDAAVGVVVHKRRGYGPAAMGGTYVTMTLDDLVALLIGSKTGETA
ncbi:hypothetical protein D3C86_1816850 [compost metagenome]